MADHAVAHDRITVPEGTNPAEVRVLAERKAQAQIPQGYRVAFLYLHGAKQVSSETGEAMEWRYSYQSVPPDRPND